MVINQFSQFLNIVLKESHRIFSLGTGCFCTAQCCLQFHLCCCLHQESILVQLNNLPSFGSPATCYPISSSIELGCFEFGFCFCDSNMYAHILHLLLSQFHHCVFPESCPFNLYFQVYWHCSQHLSFIFLPRLYYVLSNQTVVYFYFNFFSSDPVSQMFAYLICLPKKPFFPSRYSF